MKSLNQSIATVLSCAFALAGTSGAWALQDVPNMPPPQEVQSDADTPPPASVQPALKSQQQLQRLLAPIALYPDNLLGQILAASTYPAQIVEAQRWMQQHRGLKGEELAQAVDQQPWDPSVKALTEFPKVLANMDKNLAWTSALGDAYLNQPDDVTNAVQTLRQRARDAGNLRSNEQETVTDQGQTIVIEPANPDVVYVPEYDPWIVYGAPLAVWPGWAPYGGLYIGGPGIEFGVGFGIGFFAGFGWGWGGWGVNWGAHRVWHNHAAFFSHSPTFFNRAGFNHGGGGFGGHGGFRFGNGGAAFHRSGATSFGGGHGDAFGGYNHGGVTHGFSARGQSSMGGFHGGGFHGGGFGGGGFHGGGGGFHGGGGGSHGGGGRR